jgi:hypothetical protein
MSKRKKQPRHHVVYDDKLDWRNPYIRAAAVHASAFIRDVVVPSLTALPLRANAASTYADLLEDRATNYMRMRASPPTYLLLSARDGWDTARKAAHNYIFGETS